MNKLLVRLSKITYTFVGVEMTIPEDDLNISTTALFATQAF